jgi:exodeoxyribonuclease V beta subunit
MESFDVMQRDLAIHKSRLLEASAGTGKTYSIENLFVRFLLEPCPITNQPHPIEKILVVTFTRAATRELKTRIRLKVEKTLELLGSTSSSMPDYLIPILESGEEALFHAKRRLKDALFGFDSAQIYTIHGFCSRTLSENFFEGGLRMGSGNSQKGNSQEISNLEVLEIIHHYFRTGLTEENYSPEQIRILLKSHKNQIHSLEKAILSRLNQRREIVGGIPFSSHFKQFQEAFKVLKKSQNESGEELINQFINLAPNYKETCDAKGGIKPQILEKMRRFATLWEQEKWCSSDFDQLLSDGLVIVEALDSKLLKKKIKGDYKEWDFCLRLQKELFPIIEEARNPLLIFARLARECQEYLKKFLQIEEKYGPDDLLRMMSKAVDNSNFAQKVRSTYSAVIIDEFQDTDPVQWKIFDALFNAKEWPNGALYLVGDPKQSIYAFRQADIYTYLKAAEKLGEACHASLDTNYRSDSRLVNALNSLFNNNISPGLIKLPLLEQELEVREVKSGAQLKELLFTDELGSLHFCIAKGEIGRGKLWPSHQLEAECFFPFIAQEIQRLKEKDQISYRQWAILVKDRYQGERLNEFLKKHNIPAILQRSKSLADSSALSPLAELLYAVVHPKNEGAVKAALGGKIIGWNDLEIQDCQLPEVMEKVLLKFSSLRNTLFQEGFAPFFETVMQSSFSRNSEAAVREALLQRKNGLDFYNHLQQLAELLMEEENHHAATPEGLIKFLTDLPLLDFDEDERLKARIESEQDGVNILSTHASKGLEYDIVFALGLASRTHQREEFIPKKMDGEVKWHAAIDKESKEFQKAMEEIDAEKMRQLYVAMTRAKYRLYVPAAVTTTPSVVDNASASPVELFLAILGKEPASYSEIYERISCYQESDLIRSINENGSEHITYSLIGNLKAAIEPVEENLSKPVLIEPKTVKVPGNLIWMQSFTSLSKLMHGEDTLDESASLGVAPQDFLFPIKTPHTLPSNTDTGNLLHQILENLIFEELQSIESPDKLQSRILPFLEETYFYEWQETICEIIYNTLKSPIGENGFTLCEISSRKQKKEMEFLFPTPDGYMKGFIDLFFEHQNKYYIVDWKSNWLGPSIESYRQGELETCMKKNEYHLQASIYIEALKRYLKITDPREFSDCFGGVYYLFLRGMSPIYLYSGVYRGSVSNV